MRCLVGPLTLVARLATPRPVGSCRGAGGWTSARRGTASCASTACCPCARCRRWSGGAPRPSATRTRACASLRGTGARCGGFKERARQTGRESMAALAQAVLLARGRVGVGQFEESRPVASACASDLPASVLPMSALCGMVGPCPSFRWCPPPVLLCGAARRCRYRSAPRELPDLCSARPVGPPAQSRVCPPSGVASRCRSAPREHDDLVEGLLMEQRLRARIQVRSPPQRPPTAHPPPPASFTPCRLVPASQPSHPWGLPSPHSVAQLAPRPVPKP